MDATHFERDEDETANRLPAKCPFCGHDGGFDAQGRESQTTEVTDEDGTITLRKRWSQHRCTECGGIFKMLDGVEEVDE